VLLDQKLIIEYNGLYWHAREGNEENWNSNIKTFDESIEYDKIKKNFIEEKGYVIIYVWEDENFDERRKEIIDYVKARLHR
jgi:very-short-patch-repair endonuclease